MKEEFECSSTIIFGKADIDYSLCTIILHKIHTEAENMHKVCISAW
jgi:hypothetical protein